MTEDDITALLHRAATGDRGCMAAVFSRLYPELKRLARAQWAKGDATLNPTALVHELFLRMGRNVALSLESRRHFFACAARAMRGIVVDHLRAVAALKRGGDAETITLGAADDAISIDSEPLLEMDRALERLQAVDPALCELVELHQFAGIELKEIAQLRAVSEKTVHRHWRGAMAFLRAQLSEGAETSPKERADGDRA